MKSFKKLIALVTLTLATSMTASGAPMPEQALDPTGQVIDTDTAVQILDEALSGPSTHPLRRFRSITNIWNRDLAGTLKPVLTSAQGVTEGVSKGVDAGAGDIDQGVHSAGSAVSNIVGGAADTAEGTVQGADNTVANTPQAVNDLVKALEHGGPAGQLLGALFG